jgi:hypothetical protein
MKVYIMGEDPVTYAILQTTKIIPPFFRSVSQIQGFAGSPAKPCVCIIGLNRMLLRKLKHAVNKMLSRQGQYVGRNRPSPRCTVPAGRNVPPKIHIPSLTGRVRGVRRLFSTNI